MRILILGGTGMLGHKLVQILSRKHNVHYTLRTTFKTVERFDLFDRDKAIENVNVVDLGTFENTIVDVKPDVVINAVGIVKQRQEAADIEITLTVNSILPHRLARLSKSNGFRLITLSTDCVFAGSCGMYSEDDRPDALDLYGQSKHWGEVGTGNCLTIRTSIIGRELSSNQGLLEWLVSHRNGSVRGYSNAIFSGFPTLVFADIIVDILERHQELSGVIHVSSEPISKFELLEKISAQLNLGVTIIKDPEFIVDRSLDSTKFRESTGFSPPSWDDMIARVAADPTPYDKWRSRTY